MQQYRYYENIQAVPQAFEVAKTVEADLQHLLHHVVQHEEAEDDLTHPHKVVPAGHIAHQAHSLELPWGHSTPCGWKLHQQSVKDTKGACNIHLLAYAMGLHNICILEGKNPHFNV